MKTSHVFFLMGAAWAAVSTAALGQIGTGATLTNNNATWQQFDSPTTINVSGASLPFANFQNGLPGSTADQAFQNWWFFRLPTDGREFNFASASNRVVTADTLSLDFNGVINGSLNARMFQRVIGLGGNQAQLVQSMTITNNGAAASTLALVHYFDLDANGTFSGDTYSIMPGVDPTFSVSEGPTSIMWKGYGANRYQATAFSNLRTFLTNAGINDLDNTVAGSPGDFTGGFQWDLTIPAGGSITVYSGVGVNAPAIPEPTALGLLAVGGMATLRRRRV